MRCVGSAVYNEHGEVIGAVSVSGPTVRVTDERLGELGPMVKRAAAEITERVGGTIPKQLADRPLDIGDAFRHAEFLAADFGQRRDALTDFLFRRARKA